MIALRSGTVSIARNIMENSVKNKFDFNKLNKKRTINEENYITNQTQTLINSCKSSVFVDGYKNNEILEAIKETKAFSFIIDKKYDGNKFSVDTQSKTKYLPDLANGKYTMFWINRSS